MSAEASLFALLAGVSASQTRPLQRPQLKEDLAAVSKALAGWGCPLENQRLVQEETASRAGLLAGLAWLAGKLDKGNPVIVYLAGHVWQQQASGRYYLLPADVQADDWVTDLPLSALALDDAADYLARAGGASLRSPAVLFCLDGGQPVGYGRSWMEIPAGWKPAAPPPELLLPPRIVPGGPRAAYTVPPDWGVLVSTRGEEISQQPAGRGAGAFAAALAAALAQADKWAAPTSLAEALPALCQAVIAGLPHRSGERGLPPQQPGWASVQTHGSRVETTRPGGEESQRTAETSPTRHYEPTMSQEDGPAAAPGDEDGPVRKGLDREDSGAPASSQPTISTDEALIIKGLPKTGGGEPEWPAIEASFMINADGSGGDASKGLEPESLVEAAPEPEDVSRDLEPVDTGQASSAPDANAPRYLNATIEGQDPDRPLPLDEEFTLAFSVDLRKLRGGLAAAFAGSGVHRPDERYAPVSVHLISSDFHIYTQSPQELRIPPAGRSRNRARFDLLPLRSGECHATALFFRENNFIQGMTLTFNVAEAQTGESAIAEPLPPAVQSLETLGRPLENLGLLQRRDATLFVQQTASGYELTLVGAAAATARLPISEAFLAQIALDARAALSEAANLKIGEAQPLMSGLQIPPEASQQALRILARAGLKLFRRLFPDAPETREMAKALKAMTSGGTLHLQIVSRQFLLPWGLLYLGDDLNNIQIDQFLGFQHVIEQIPLLEGMRAVDPQIPGGTRLPAGLGLNSDVDALAAFLNGRALTSEQEAAWQGRQQRSQAELQIWRTAAELEQALNDPDLGVRLLYFYGHALAGQLGAPGSADAATMVLSGDSKLTLEDLNLALDPGLPLRGQPLIFINACQSAQLSPLFYEGFMQYFTRRGARGMIGTECDVPALFAAEWAGRFFERFFAGEPVGEIFLALRRQFVDEFGNPLGLVYALYCDADTRLG